MLPLRHKQYNMDKSKTFVGQPILSQILDTIPSSIINTANRKHTANRYYKRIPLRVHWVSLLYGVFSYCNGLRELCEGMLACEGVNYFIWVLTKLLLAVPFQMPIPIAATLFLKPSTLNSSRIDQSDPIQLKKPLFC